MTPGERWAWAKRDRINKKLAVYDAIEASEMADMEYHYARFVYVAASVECPTCQAPPGTYCAIWQREDGSYTSSGDAPFAGSTRLVALFLHPARTTTAAAREAATAEVVAA